MNRKGIDQRLKGRREVVSVFHCSARFSLNRMGHSLCIVWASVAEMSEWTSINEAHESTSCVCYLTNQTTVHQASTMLAVVCSDQVSIWSLATDTRRQQSSIRWVDPMSFGAL